MTDRRARALKGWDTRRARAAARSDAARRGWETRRKNALVGASRHGQKARERTERALTPAQKAARTRDAKRIQRDLRRELEREAYEGPTRTRKPAYSLDDFDYFDDDDFIEIETSPDYGED